MSSPEPEELGRSRRRTRQTLDFLNEQAERAEVAERDAADARGALQKLEGAHPEFASGSVTRAAVGVVVILVVFGVFALDVVLFNATAEFFARQAFPNSPLLIMSARLILPAGFLLVEIITATQIFAAREESEETGEAFAYYCWLILGGILVLVVPASVVATLLAARIAKLGDAAETALDWQLCALVVAAFVAHAVVVFSGRQGHEAKVWAIFVTLRGTRRRTVRQHERARRRALTHVQRAYTRYASLREAHNAAYPDRAINTAPFTRSAREALRNLAGHEVVVMKDPMPAVQPEPATAASSIAPVAIPEPPEAVALAPEATADGDVAVRDEDSEVKA